MPDRAYVQCIECKGVFIYLRDENWHPSSTDTVKSEYYIHADGEDVLPHEPFQCDSCGSTNWSVTMTKQHIYPRGPVTKVVNRHAENFDVYIGRGTPYGNPYIIGKDGTREEVIEKYKTYFYKKIRNPRFKRQILELEGKVLGCSCKPRACHGDIIVQYLLGN